MQEDLGLTPLTEGLVTSSLLFGAAFGALFGGRLADRNGRRKMIMVLAVIFLVGTLACTLCPEHRGHDRWPASSSASPSAARPSPCPSTSPKSRRAPGADGSSPRTS